MELIFHIATLTVLCLESIDNTALFWVPLRSAGTALGLPYQHSSPSAAEVWQDLEKGHSLGS